MGDDTVKFSSLNVGDKFKHKGVEYFKTPRKMKSCCVPKWNAVQVDNDAKHILIRLSQRVWPL